MLEAELLERSSRLGRFCLYEEVLGVVCGPACDICVSSGEDGRSFLMLMIGRRGGEVTGAT